MATLVKALSPRGDDGPRVGIPERALISYSELIIIKVVGCDLITIIQIHLSQPVGSVSFYGTAP